MIERADKVSSMTCHHDGVCAKRFFAYAAREKFVERNVLADWQVRKAPTPYVKCPTAEELQALLRSIVRRWDPKENPSCRSIPARRRTFFRHRNLAIIAGLIETGCRAGELFALTMQDYQPQVPQIVIRTSKTDEPRIVPITPAWMELVNSYLAVRPKKLDSDYLFVGEYGLPLDVGDFGHALKRQVEFAGLAGITQHTLRHYAATNMNDKVGLVAAKALLGHRSIQTTVKYIRDGSRLAAGAQATANTLGNILQNKSTARARRKRII
ncbi:MAG TPA: tyrosine-type recombinase/integrase [Terriglobales bacterium]|nr:tyrosine-type recombinase/integrase [Terriglobales bacterium]